MRQLYRPERPAQSPTREFVQARRLIASWRARAISSSVSGVDGYSIMSYM
ncbi:hypothetical protein BQ8420_04765 [Nocardiopsis sp. JB363]|nr:hypothetical protein BQ8420_04765 [Nocardiopsis sp. JB363]